MAWFRQFKQILRIPETFQLFSNFFKKKVSNFYENTQHISFFFFLISLFFFNDLNFRPAPLSFELTRAKLTSRHLLRFFYPLFLSVHLGRGGSVLLLHLSRSPPLPPLWQQAKKRKEGAETRFWSRPRLKAALGLVVASFLLLLYITCATGKQSCADSHFRRDDDVFSFTCGLQVPRHTPFAAEGSVPTATWNWRHCSPLRRRRCWRLRPPPWRWTRACSWVKLIIEAPEKIAEQRRSSLCSYRIFFVTAVRKLTI